MLQGFLTSYYETDYLPKWLSPDERGMMPIYFVQRLEDCHSTKYICPTQPGSDVPMLFSLSNTL